MKIVETHYFCLGKRNPVKEFLDELDNETYLKFIDTRDLLEEYGHRLTEPQTKPLKDGISELRFTGIEGGIRVLYFWHYNNVIFTNGFIKKTKKTPAREIKIALRRRKMFIDAQNKKG